MTQLIFKTPEFSGQSASLPDGKTTVGRAPGNALIIEHDSVSADHCELLLYGREVIVRVRASANGTWVDGALINGQTSMRHGQVIRFGTVEARLEMPPPPPRDDQTEFTAIYTYKEVMRQPPGPMAPPPPVVIKPRP
jgi:pSer/pThr/pTyr-binding forkhead associated (FHA) protein